MLEDGGQGVSTTSVFTEFNLESGGTLPTSNLVEGRLFWLNTTSGGNAYGLYVYHNSAWVTGGIQVNQTPYDLSAYVPGVPTASTDLMIFVAVRAYTIPANFVGSAAKSFVAATNSTVYSVKKNGTQFATITWASSGTVGSFSVQASESFGVGDILSVVAPAVADSTHGNISWTFLADLT